MDKLLKHVTKVVKSLNKDGFTFNGMEDNCEDHLSYHDIEGHEFVIGDDNERESWNTTIREVTGKRPLTEVLLEVLGPPSKTHDHDPKRVVYNWEPQKNVLIVHVKGEDDVEFTQYYSKR